MSRAFLSHARRNAVAYLALFVALGGTTYAAVSLPANSVGPKQIKKNAVTASKIRANAVNSSKIKDGSLLSADFKPGQLVAGAPGPTGAPGSTGPKGDKGDTGPTGVVDPSRVTRVAFDQSNGDQPMTSTNFTYRTATITAPTSGFLVAHTSGYIDSSVQASCPCIIQARLGLDADAPVIVTNTNLGTVAGDYVGGFDRRSFAGSQVFQVTAGSHTVQAIAVQQQASSLSGVAVGYSALQVTFVPFNAAGSNP